MKEFTITVRDSYAEILEDELEGSRLSIEEYLSRIVEDSIEQLEAGRLQAEKQAELQASAGGVADRDLDRELDEAADRVLEELEGDGELEEAPGD